MNLLAESWRSKSPRLLGWSEIASPVLIGMMARAGYDVILLDQQHGSHDFGSSLASINEACITQTPVLVRVPIGNFAEAARMLDAGAAGVVAPMINTEAEAHDFASFAKFAPIGSRSYGPSRAMQIGNVSSGSEFLASANNRSLAIIMCETRSALDSLERILQVPGIDGVMAGPGDLSVALSNGTSFDPAGPPVRSAMQHVARVARKTNKLACAFAATPDRTRQLIEDGYHVVGAGYDFRIISEAFCAVVSEIKKS